MVACTVCECACSMYAIALDKGHIKPVSVCLGHLCKPTKLTHEQQLSDHGQSGSQ